MASETPFEMKVGVNGVDWTKLIYTPATSAYGQATKGLLEVGASCLHDHRRDRCMSDRPDENHFLALPVSRNARFRWCEATANPDIG